MRHTVIALIALLPLVLVLSACGKSEQPTAPATEAGAVSAVTGEAPVALPPAAVDDEVLVYDSIDTSKLRNTWWEQYNKGG